MIYDKLQHLQNLNLDLNADNPEAQEELTRLFEMNQEALLLQEAKLEKKTRVSLRHAFQEFICENIATAEKAKLVDKKYLSSGELELTFLKDWESFSKLYSEDSYEYQKNKKREDKQLAEHTANLQLQEATENFFN